MKQGSLEKQERERIFSLFLKNKSMLFSEIEDIMGIRSNHLAYHLEQMQKDNVVEKKDDRYVLTKHAEHMLPFFNQMTGKEVGVLPVVLAAIIKDGKILLLRREKRPYKDYWGLIGGKPKVQESIPDAALREVKEETGLDCSFNAVHEVIHERVEEDGETKHSFLLIVTSVKPLSDKLVHSEEGVSRWFDLRALDKSQIIPSDCWIIDNCLKRKSSMPSVLMVQKDEKLVRFELS